MQQDHRNSIRILATGAALAFCAPAFAQTKINLGTVQSFGAVVTYIAKDKGYLRDAGIELNISQMNSSANVMAILAKGDLSIVEGGVSVGFFNAVDKAFPIIMTTDRVSTPIHHQLLVAPKHKGQITTLGQLKGKNVGTNAAGSVTTYEIGKMLEKVGMSLKDVELKIVGFPQMGAALKNGALDATLIIPPFAAAFEQQGLGFAIANPDSMVEPSPMTIAVSYVNTEWAAKNKEVMKKFFVAYLRATRDYCLAYHHGPNRKEVIEIALKNGLERSADNVEKNPWTGRNMNGAINMPSIMDMQKYYLATGFVKREQAAEKLYTSEYIDHANKVLGPPPAVNPQSKLPGCR